MNRIIRTIKEELENYSEPVDILTSVLMAALLMFISFVGYSRLTLTYVELKFAIATKAPVFITYYGFPFSMIGILTPIGNQQTMTATWNQIAGNSNTRVLWGGLLANFIIFFLLSFFMVYLYRKFIKR